MEEYYIKKEDINGNISFEKVEMDKLEIYGHNIEEISMILRAMDAERETGILMTMENLQKYVDLITNEHEKARQDAINNAFRNLSFES